MARKPSLLKTKKSKKIKESLRCEKCGVELSTKEINAPSLYILEGEYYYQGLVCAICNGDLREKLYGTRKL